MSDEFDPFIVFRIKGGQFECALWQVAGPLNPDEDDQGPKAGERALALFLSNEAASAYCETAGLVDWQIFRPARMALLELVRACHQEGIRYAVLDPDLKQAKRIFNLGAILAAASSLTDGQSPGA